MLSNTCRKVTFFFQIAKMSLYLSCYPSSKNTQTLFISFNFHISNFKFNKPVLTENKSVRAENKTVLTENKPVRTTVRSGFEIMI